MTRLTRNIASTLPGFQNPEAAVFLAQLEDQNRRLIEDTRGLTPAELERQLLPGMNTIGMLLAHIAIVEVYWTSKVARTELNCREVLGIDTMDDGMPLAADGKPPQILSGKELEFFDDLLVRARRNTRERFVRLEPGDLEGSVDVTPGDGQEYRLNGRWILYHMVEHEAAHYGQINLLRHWHHCEARPWAL